MDGQASDILQRLSSLSDEDRFAIGRIVRGEAAEDSIRRGDVHEAIRSLRTNPVPSHEYQRALADVQKLVSKIDAVKQQITPGMQP